MHWADNSTAKNKHVSALWWKKQEHLFKRILAFLYRSYLTANMYMMTKICV